jgi:hypothetical protein
MPPPHSNTQDAGLIADRPSAKELTGSRTSCFARGERTSRPHQMNQQESIGRSFPQVNRSFKISEKHLTSDPFANASKPKFIWVDTETHETECETPIYLSEILRGRADGRMAIDFNPVRKIDTRPDIEILFTKTLTRDNPPPLDTAINWLMKNCHQWFPWASPE